MPVTALNHYLIVSKDLERSRDFYCRVLGMGSPSGPISASPATG